MIIKTPLRILGRFTLNNTGQFKSAPFKSSAPPFPTANSNKNGNK